MRFVWGITRSWTAAIPSFVPEHQTPADVSSPSSSRPAMWIRTTRVRTTTSPPRESWRTSRTRGRPGGGALQSPLEGIRRIQGFVGASEQLCAEVHHGLDGLSEEEEHFFGCQGRVGPFGGCRSTVMDPPWHFCLFLCLGDG